MEKMKRPKIGDETAWLKELDKRANEVASGRVKVESWTKVRKRIEARLRARQG
jgi:hypothetical protein